MHPILTSRLSLVCLSLPKRDYRLRHVRVFAIADPSVCLSVTFVHPTQGVEIFGNIFRHFEP